MRSVAWLADSVEEVESRLQSSIADGIMPSLAIVFASPAHDLAAVGACFGRHNIDVFGSASGGGILNEEVREGSIAVLLLDIDREAYRIKMFDVTDRAYYELGKRIAEWGKPIFPEPAYMVVVGGFLADGDEIIAGIIQTMGREIPLFGGLAGNDQFVPETPIFDSSSVLSEGASALVFNQDLIEIRGVAASGWMGVGVTKTITKAKGNLVYEIDNEPALDSYKKYLGIEDDILAAIEYPLLVMRDDESFVFRAALAMNEDGSIAYGGSVPEGAKVRFSIPPGLEIVDYCIEQISKISQSDCAPDAIVLFSCKARHLTLGPLIENEMSAIRELWDVPIVGFFTGGEIGPHPTGICDFHGTAIVPVLIRDKQALEE